MQRQNDRLPFTLYFVFTTTIHVRKDAINMHRGLQSAEYSSANLKRKKERESHSEGIKIGRIDAAAGHKSAQKGESPKGGATGEIVNFTTENAGLW